MADGILGPTLQATAALVFVYLVYRFLTRSRPPPALRSVALLVLGDVGRSPRMMYHAESFAKLGFETYIVGYEGAKPTTSLLSLPRVRFLYLPPPPIAVRALPFLLGAPWKVAHQCVSILQALLVRAPHPPEYLLVQNPPSIPTLALVSLIAATRGTKVIIDWHNLGYSILALRLGNKHVFVKLARRFEATFGRRAYAHLFVTQAMCDHLSREWSLQGRKVVLHDRPPAHFRRAAQSEIHELFLRLAPNLPTDFLPRYSTPYSTPMTEVKASRTTSVDSAITDPTMASNQLAMPCLRKDRPALVVSSTSWTPDEDFSILLAALSAYEHAARSPDSKLPKVLCVVTGKGPDRDKYMAEVQSLQRGTGEESPWEHVRCISLWLEAEDYPVLLGSADVGVSLHASSSALDLPMKIVDMFGCGLPVCALDFACLPELVHHEENGLVFRTAEELANHLRTLLTGFPHLSTTLRSLQKNLQASSRPANRSIGEEIGWGSWDENWDAVVRPLVTPGAEK
ncbi:glycosyltransferase family 33 protein [Peniophora sp. CONT]|nr:glycosyltransferase family 33 protein [Peniophora sp. CONT]